MIDHEGLDLRSFRELVENAILMNLPDWCPATLERSDGMAAVRPLDVPDDDALLLPTEPFYDLFTENGRARSWLVGALRLAWEQARDAIESDKYLDRPFAEVDALVQVGPEGNFATPYDDELVTTEGDELIRRAFAPLPDIGLFVWPFLRGKRALTMLTAGLAARLGVTGDIAYECALARTRALHEALLPTVETEWRGVKARLWQDEPVGVAASRLLWPDLLTTLPVRADEICLVLAVDRDSLLVVRAARAHMDHALTLLGMKQQERMGHPLPVLLGPLFIEGAGTYRVLDSAAMELLAAEMAATRAASDGPAPDMQA